MVRRKALGIGVPRNVGDPERGAVPDDRPEQPVRAVFSQRTVVACDVVELSPLPGVLAPNFLCAKLVYKMLAYKYGQMVKDSRA